MGTKITPTQCRMMLYHPEAQQATTHAAMVAYVHPNGLVNLAVYTHDGGLYCRNNVPVVQDGDTEPTSGHFATWLPYQLGQAAKTEQVEDERIKGAVTSAVLEARKEIADELTRQDEIIAELTTRLNFVQSNAMFHPPGSSEVPVPPPDPAPALETETTG